MYISDNYRPISLLSIFNKIFDKIVHRNLMQFLERHSILFMHQFGYRKLHSTTIALIDITDRIDKLLDEQQPGADASDVTATNHLTDVTTQPCGKVNQTATDAQGPLFPVESLHCHAQCKVGTNGCATKCPTNKIFNKFRDISLHAKHVSCTGTVKFSGITPRIDTLWLLQGVSRSTTASGRSQKKTNVNFCVTKTTFYVEMGIPMNNCHRSMVFTCPN